MWTGHGRQSVGPCNPCRNWLRRREILGQNHSGRYPAALTQRAARLCRQAISQAEQHRSGLAMHIWPQQRTQFSAGRLASVSRVGQGVAFSACVSLAAARAWLNKRYQHSSYTSVSLAAQCSCLRLACSAIPGTLLRVKAAPWHHRG